MSPGSDAARSSGGAAEPVDAAVDDRFGADVTDGEVLALLRTPRRLAIMNMACSKLLEGVSPRWAHLICGLMPFLLRATPRLDLTG